MGDVLSSWRCCGRGLRAGSAKEVRRNSMKEVLPELGVPTTRMLESYQFDGQF